LPDSALRIFPDEFVANAEASTYHRQWVAANPKEAVKWVTFRAAVMAGTPSVSASAMQTKYGKALVAAGKEHMAISRILGQMQNPYPPVDPAPVLPPPPPPPPGTVLFDGKPTTTTVVPPWDIANESAPGRLISSPGIDGVTPRLPGRLIRCEVRQTDTLYGAGTNTAQLIRDEDNLGHGSGPGEDIYTGFSLFLPNGFPFIQNSLFNYFFEWHGNTSAVQAPFKLGVNTIISGQNLVPGFHCELHTQTGFNPQIFRFGDVITGQWVDFVFRTKWDTAGNGVLTGWMNGNVKFNYLGVTWYPLLQATRVNPQMGYYRSSFPTTVFSYYDACKIGTTREVVDPANY
jgi:hypothetical protein